LLRWAAVVLVLGAVVAGGWSAARYTSVFAVRSVTVVGAPPGVAREVAAAVAGVRGTSLVTIDVDAVRRQVALLPTVADVSVDRAFPQTLRILVEPERPLAVIRSGREAWLVSRRGRIMRLLDVQKLPVLPRVWLPSATASEIEIGRTVGAGDQLAAIRALATLPAGFPVRVAAARAGVDDLVLVLGTHTELRLGTTDDLALKLAVAGRILATLKPAERQNLAYLDVGVPERAVASDKSQLES
jgi:cell division protein FtsQ